MLPLEHSAILLTCIKRYSVLKTNFCVLFEWPLKTGFTVIVNLQPILKGVYRMIHYLHTLKGDTKSGSVFNSICFSNMDFLSKKEITPTGLLLTLSLLAVTFVTC